MTADEKLIEEAAWLAAQCRTGDGGRMIDAIIVFSNTVRTARKARWKPSMIAPLEDDLCRVLAQFYRKADWYLEPTREAHLRN